MDRDTPATLFDRGYARTDHPWTSHAAADAISPRLGRLQARVFSELERCAATDEEMQESLGMKAHTQCARRLELCEMGLVRATREVRCTEGRQSAVVWELTPAEEVEDQREQWAIERLRRSAGRKARDARFVCAARAMLDPALFRRLEAMARTEEEDEESTN